MLEEERCEQLRERQVDVCSLQEVSWRGQDTRLIGVKGRGY